MSRRRRMLLSSVAAAAGLACLLTMNVRGGSEVQTADASTDPTKANPGELMQRKLSASENVLQGLVQGELPLVARAASELRDISRTDNWGQHRRDAVFSHFNIEFQRLSEQLVQLAEQGNAEGAAWAHEQLTATCINCHRHVRDVKRLSDQQAFDTVAPGAPGMPRSGPLNVDRMSPRPIIDINIHRSLQNR